MIPSATASAYFGFDFGQWTDYSSSDTDSDDQSSPKSTHSHSGRHHRHRKYHHQSHGNLPDVRNEKDEDKIFYYNPHSGNSEFVSPSLLKQSLMNRAQKFIHPSKTSCPSPASTPERIETPKRSSSIDLHLPHFKISNPFKHFHFHHHHHHQHHHHHHDSQSHSRRSITKPEQQTVQNFTLCCKSQFIYRYFCFLKISGRNKWRRSSSGFEDTSFDSSFKHQHCSFPKFISARNQLPTK